MYRIRAYTFTGGFFHSTYVSFIHAAEWTSSLSLVLLHSIPLCENTTIYLSILLLIGIFFLYLVAFVISVQFSSVQSSHSVVSDSLRPHESQHTRPPSPSPSPRVHSDSCPSSQWAIQPSHPGPSPSPPASNPSQHQSLFQWVNSSHEVAKVLEFQL